MIRRTLIGLLAICPLASCGSNEQPVAPEPEHVVEQPDPDAVIRAAAEDGVRNALKDPDSAKFRQVGVYRAQKLVCGQVNSKNSFGGYSGFQDFVIDGDTLYMADMHPRETERGIKKCTKVHMAEMQADMAATEIDTKKVLRDGIANVRRMISDARTNKDFTPEIRDKLIHDLEQQLAEMERDQRAAS